MGGVQLQYTQKHGGKDNSQILIVTQMFYLTIVENSILFHIV